MCHWAGSWYAECALTCATSADCPAEGQPVCGDGGVDQWSCDPDGVCVVEHTPCGPEALSCLELDGGPTCVGCATDADCDPPSCVDGDVLLERECTPEHACAGVEVPCAAQSGCVLEAPGPDETHFWQDYGCVDDACALAAETECPLGCSEEPPGGCITCVDDGDCADAEICVHGGTVDAYCGCTDDTACENGGVPWCTGPDELVGWTCQFFECVDKYVDCLGDGKICVDSAEGAACAGCTGDADCGDGEVCLYPGQDEAACACVSGDACPGGTGGCCSAEESWGCEDALCQACVCLHGPECCDQADDYWNPYCAGVAAQECAGYCPCDDSPCCEPHTGGGCAEAACESCVCADMPSCCSGEWTAECATLAALGTCAGVCPCAGPCCDAHASPGCDDYPCQACVCSQEPYCCGDAGEWNYQCAADARGLCADACACAERGPCCLGHEGQGCEEPLCEACVCDLDPSCCTTEWTAACAALAGGAQCAETCGCPGGCCEAGTDPGCVDTACMECVCDGYAPGCCLDGWGADCADYAMNECNPTCGCDDWLDCASPHETPGCGEPLCADCVCDVLPSCCSGAWTQDCAIKARTACGDVCPIDGPCCVGGEHGDCSSPTCEACVGGYFSLCVGLGLEGAWSEMCANFATYLCGEACDCDADCCASQGGQGCATDSGEFCGCVDASDCPASTCGGLGGTTWECADGRCVAADFLCAGATPLCGLDEAGAASCGACNANRDGCPSGQCLDPGTPDARCACATAADCGVPACMGDVAANPACIASGCEWVEEDCAGPAGGCGIVGAAAACLPCSDGTLMLCGDPPPICPPGEVVTVQLGCWTCVDPNTCDPNACYKSSACGPGEYCAQAPGDCTLVVGSCAPMPAECPDTYEPVCACNNSSSFINACVAAQAGKNVGTAGLCNAHCVSNDDCPLGTFFPDGICYKGPDKCGTTIGTCQPDPALHSVYDPVCGCDGVSYFNVKYAIQAGISWSSVPGPCGTDPCVTSADCAGDHYCAKPAGSCVVAGDCVKRPAPCTDDGSILCGCDGTGYENACAAAQQGASVSYAGKCIVANLPCQSNQDCWPDQYCGKSTGQCDAAGWCMTKPPSCPPLFLEPVCGCDGVEYLDFCQAQLAGVSVDHTGPCPPGH